MTVSPTARYGRVFVEPLGMAVEGWRLSMLGLFAIGLVLGGAMLVLGTDPPAVRSCDGQVEKVRRPAQKMLLGRRDAVHKAGACGVAVT